MLITGPTGAGKTSTLYSALADIHSPERNIVTLEDPVEVQMPGITQVQVHERSGLTFSRGLRAVLRQDPDVVLLGEIRDSETAELAVRASLTGHLVLTTLHTNSAVSAMTRLVDMGVEPFMVASALSAVVAQRLVRRPCQGCVVPDEPGPCAARVARHRPVDARGGDAAARRGLRGVRHSPATADAPASTRCCSSTSTCAGCWAATRPSAPSSGPRPRDAHAARRGAGEGPRRRDDLRGGRAGQPAGLSRTGLSPLADVELPVARLDRPAVERQDADQDLVRRAQPEHLRERPRGPRTIRPVRTS